MCCTFEGIGIVSTVLLEFDLCAFPSESNDHFEQRLLGTCLMDKLSYREPKNGLRYGILGQFNLVRVIVLCFCSFFHLDFHRINLWKICVQILQNVHDAIE